MKKIATLILTFLGIAAVTPASAVEIPELIGTAGASLTTVEAAFTHTRTVKASGKTTTYTGTYYYNATDRLAMHYDQDSEGLILSSGRFFIRRSGKANKGQIQKVNQMEQLSDILFACIRGEVAKAARDNDATLSLKTEKSAWVVTLTANKKSAKGYAKVVLRYRRSDGVLEGLRMEEFNGNVNDYALRNCKTGVVIPADKFDIPKK